jgi:protoheme IX farnesyltransferase
VAGAIPPCIGWLATGASFSMEPFLMFLVILFWTMPHTWALCLFIYEDYARANIPMMPAVKGIYSTKIQMLGYTILMVLSSCIGAYIGIYDIFYIMGAIFLNSLFFYFQGRVIFSNQKKHSIHLFIYSIIYLFCLFILMIIGRT